MKRFARAGNRVVFVNSISMGLPGLASKDLLPRVARKLRSYAKLARTTEEGITVVSPAALPFYGSSAARGANRRLVAAPVGALARGRGRACPPPAPRRGWGRGGRAPPPPPARICGLRYRPPPT